MRLRRRSRALTELAQRLESGDPTAYTEVEPSVYDQLGPSVWDHVREPESATITGHVRGIVRPDGESCPHGVLNCHCDERDCPGAPCSVE